MKFAARALLVAYFLCLLPIALHAFENKECLACHDNVDQPRFEKSIHGKNLCTSCHTDVTKIPHEVTPGPVKCGNCHKIEDEIYRNGDHGIAVTSGVTDAASCKACHGEGHYLLNSRDTKSPVFRGNIVETCAKCHADAEKMAPYKLTVRDPYKSYMDSVHGQALQRGELFTAVCTDCHGSHDLHSPNNPESKIYKFNIPATCGKCHANDYNTFRISIHAQALAAGVKDAPTCTDCHGEHDIKSKTDVTSQVYPSQIVKTCGNCHASEKLASKYGLPADIIPTYLDSYHGTAYQYGSITVANCASCHGFHDILPSTDPRSSVSPKNIGDTCGRCHVGAGKSLAKGSVHVRPSLTRDRVLYYVTIIYITLIVLTIGGMLFHNLLDILRKLIRRYRKAKAEGAAMRMSLNERLQHFVLLTCFGVLVYTGFAHKYPTAFFSYPFSLGETGPLVRKVAHRVAGIIFILQMSYHFIWMTCTKYGREKVRALMPKLNDLKDALKLVGYNIGFVSERPKFDRYSYIEKAEYWALIWGSCVMIITGLILMFENVSLSFMPKWLIDVILLIHFFEALLATLAIVVWHFYWTIFDPDIYPMNFSWLTGKVTKEQLEERKEPVDEDEEEITDEHKD